MPTLNSLDNKTWELPPLILHPFNERVPPSALLENSKAALMLSGLIPGDGTEPSVLKRRLLGGRHAEMRMLFFLGKDVLRWMEQCQEWAVRFPELAALDTACQSFAGLLIGSPPNSVKEKLVKWGVADYVSIFGRAIGINALFAEPPVLETLSEEFLRNYHRYADCLYRTYMESQPYARLNGANFTFTLYASGEYSRMLSSEWEGV